MRGQFLRQFVVARDFLYEFVVFAIVLERRFADKTPAFDAPMILRDRKVDKSPADFRHLRRSSTVLPSAVM